AGALVGTDGGLRLAPEVSGLGSARDRHELKRLVEQAVRAAHARAPEPTREALSHGEGLAHRLRLGSGDASAHPLLRGVLDRSLHDLARAAADGGPASDADVASLRSNLHARGCEGAIALVGHVSRLARFVQRVPAPAEGAPVEAWLKLALRHV